MQHEAGLHARSAAKLVKLARSFPCDISVRKVGGADGRSASARSILSVLSLGVKEGDTIEIEARGDRSEEALSALRELVEDGLGD